MRRPTRWVVRPRRTTSTSGSSGTGPGGVRVVGRAALVGLRGYRDRFNGGAVVHRSSGRGLGQRCFGGRHRGVRRGLTIGGPVRRRGTVGRSALQRRVGGRRGVLLGLLL